MRREAQAEREKAEAEREKAEVEREQADAALEKMKQEAQFERRKALELQTDSSSFFGLEPFKAELEDEMAEWLRRHRLKNYAETFAQVAGWCADINTLLRQP